MLADLEAWDSPGFFDRTFDVAVVGAGVAGITLARALEARGWSVGLFEGGELEMTWASQELYEGETVGRDYFSLESARLRYLGGTSGHWTGRCRPYDARDFSAPNQPAFAAWPIGPADLDPYAPATDEILDLPATASKPAYLRREHADFEPIAFRWSAPTRFGDKFRAELDESSLIATFLNANLVDIGVTENGQRVSELTVATFERPGRQRITARYVVLCMGGIENVRALLNADKVMPFGIGNRHGVVGRYFNEHPHAHVGDVVFERMPAEIVFYGARDRLLEETGILPFSLRLGPVGAQRAQGSPLRRWLRSNGHAAACTTPFTTRLFEAVTGREPRCTDGTGSLVIAIEQALDPDSRVTLGEKVDRFGWRQVLLDWRLADRDLETISEATLRFADLLAQQRLARVRVAEWLLDRRPVDALSMAEVFGAWHHMCTTRMGTDPTTSVVDANCKVHEVDNLYMAGSSVFASGSYVNPTYTIVQLTLRLADHLDQRLSS